MSESVNHPPLFKRLLFLLGWSRSSSVLLGGFFLLCGLIVYIWWPLARAAIAYINWGEAWWLYMDWLLLGIFLFMSLTIMAHADLRRDALIVLVGMLGGLVIESWGTQTNLWFYYTAERPPLWIIPAWPIASLSIDRLTRGLSWAMPKQLDPVYWALYWATFGGFYALMLWFVAPTLNKSFTIAALFICALLILTPTNHRTALLVFW